MPRNAGLAELMRALSDDHDSDKTERMRPLPSAIAHDLIERAKLFNREREPFKVGDLVTQIKSLDQYRLPEVGEPALVMEIFERRIEPSEPGTQVRIVDMTIAVPDGDFAIFPVDSRRFEIWRE